MANMFFAEYSYPVPELGTVSQMVERVSQVTPYRKYERDHQRDDREKKKALKFAQVLDEEQSRRRYETGDVTEMTEIGDPGFFFDYKM